MLRNTLSKYAAYLACVSPCLLVRKSIAKFMEWISPHWFLPDTLREFNWVEERYFYLLSVIPFLYLMRRLLMLGFRQKLPVSFTETHLTDMSMAWLRFVPNMAFAFSLVCLIMALARPQRFNQRIEYHAEGIDIMLVLDISRSMLEKDFSPSRLQAAKEVARDFIKGRFEDRIGLVIFSGQAYSLIPLTTDYQLLYQALDQLSTAYIANEGTAIGNALAVATSRLRESESKTKIAVLISDGDNTAGTLDPISAAQLAYQYQVKVYTIALIRDIPLSSDTLVRTFDEATLKQIASTCKGSYFRATDKQALTDIFNQIDSFEKSIIRETKYQEKQDFYRIYLYWGIAWLLIWMALRLSFMYNVLED
jgi:Ca-activated chloride channel family protein